MNDKMSSKPLIIGRFAPSPTGPLHFGSLVAALASYLNTKSQGGHWRLRIEDIDAPRVVVGAAERIQQQLVEHGLLWDGPIVFQRQRTLIYRAAWSRLVEQKQVYSCTCSRREIAAHSHMGIDGLVYPGTCRNGHTKRNQPFAWRLRTDGVKQPIEFNDEIQGLCRQNVAMEVGDFVVWRADGLFTYQLAVVVDDAEMGVTEVVRGADLLASTARQILLQQQLNLPTPRYAHLPLVLDSVLREKLSKKTHAPPLLARDAAQSLWRALDFLQQAPPRELKTASVAEVMAWAITHWQIKQVPQCSEKSLISKV